GTYNFGTVYAMTWYAAVAPRDDYLPEYYTTAGISGYSPQYGMLKWGGKSGRIELVADGSSNTLMVAEHPPSYDLFWGWWDSGYPFYAPHVMSTTTGSNRLYPYNYGSVGPPAPNSACPNVGQFGPGHPSNACSFNAPWSNHPGGANMLMG